ncbi:sigma-70 family RNA polymerase sigma factor [Desulfosarcina ovata]|nr:sigma-70 family RNA polymerase sigma factor [Desulfosarcina ovata]
MNSQADVQTLYIDHHRWLVNWLRHRLGGLDDARDLAQDTFVRVLRRPVEIGGLRKPRAWLATIAHGLMVDHVRHRDLERAYCSALADVPEPEAPSIEGRVMLLDILAHIDAMLDGLGPKVRSAFLLSRLMGLSYPEIAVQLEVSLSSVEKYMAKAYRHCMVMRDGCYR